MLPILCVKDEALMKPSTFMTYSYNGWFPGHATLSHSMYGSELVSQAAADAVCAADLGAGFRMAEHHDGTGHIGWGFGAIGSIQAGTRFWVTIHDQPANPWDPL